MTNPDKILVEDDLRYDGHTPVIRGPDRLNGNNTLDFLITIGKQRPHPNTDEHYIKWLDVYFLAEGELCPARIIKVEFSSRHDPVLLPGSDGNFHNVKISLKTRTPGILLAAGFCNVHGLWMSSKSIEQ